MKTSSNKAKGRKGQQEVRDMLLQFFPDLDPDDVRSTPMGSPGEDLLLSPKARKVMPYSIEVKRGKAFNLVKACKQHDETKYECLAFGRYDQDKDWYVCMKAAHFLNLINYLECMKDIGEY